MPLRASYLEYIGFPASLRINTCFLWSRQVLLWISVDRTNIILFFVITLITSCQLFVKLRGEAHTSYLGLEFSSQAIFILQMYFHLKILKSMIWCLICRLPQMSARRVNQSKGNKWLGEIVHLWGQVCCIQYLLQLLSIGTETNMATL